MQCTTGWGKRHWQWGVVVHTFAVLGLMVLAGVGRYLESSGGGRCAWRAGWGWMRRSWMAVAARNGGAWFK